MSTTVDVTLKVWGKAVSQGNLTKSANGALYDKTKGLKDWRAAVRLAINDAVGQDWEQHVGPVKAEMWYFVERPASHFGTGRNAGILKSWALEREPTGKPDLDKCDRAIGDALTQSGVIKDDAQIVENLSRKMFLSDQHARPYSLITLHFVSYGAR